MIMKSDNIKYFISSCLAMIFLASCGPDGLHETCDDPVGISASVRNPAGTRAGDDEIQLVTDGTYYFSYPQQDAAGKIYYETSPCRFSEGTGYVYPTSSPLEWKHLPLLGSYDFCLDNIVDPADPNLTEINESGNFTCIGVSLDEQYSAGVEGANKNDIVWGIKSQVPYKYSGTIDIVMSHCMSRMSVTFTGEAKDMLEGKSVTVKLEGLIAGASMFNRVNGKVTLKEGEDAYGDIVIVDGEVLGSDDNGCTTPNLILPPQGLRTGANRPRLKVTVTGDDDNTTTYSGVLPTGMIYTSGGYAATLEFLAGLHLELRVSKLAKSVSEDEILFLPAVVRKWTDKGTYTVNSTQAGVYTSGDLENAIEAYNYLMDGGQVIDKERFEELKKYGYFLYGSIDDIVNNETNNIKGYVVNLFASLDNLPVGRFSAYLGKDVVRIAFNGYSIGAYRTWDEEAKNVFFEN